jgi:hypothetical protein
MGGLVRRAMEKLRIGSDAETYELAEEAIGLALDLDAELAGRLSPQSLVAMLEINNTDERVIQLVVDALAVQADVLDRAGEIVGASVRRQQADAVRALLDPDRGN